MSDKRPDVIGSLPSTRPHRRSGKRAAPGAGAAESGPAGPAPTRTPASEAKRATEATRVREARPPAASGPAAKKPPANIRPRRPAPRADRGGVEASSTAPPATDPTPMPERPGALETLVQATAELTEIGLRASARAIRGAVSRLPRP